MKKAFTLVETIIVVLIVGVLFGLLAQVYITSSGLYVYQKHLKNVEKDILFFNQNLQNLIDDSQLDYDKYTDLENNLGFTGNLYLKNNNNFYKVYLSGDVIFLDKTLNGKKITIPLTSSGLTIVKQLTFKIMPFKDPYSIVGYGENAMQPFVKVFMHIQNNYYKTGSWENSVDYKFEEGFNFKYFQN